MFRKHCSDEQLLSHLDRELSLPAAWRVEAHLRDCWRCRARRQEIEEQAFQLAKALDRDQFPGPERVAAAAAKLDARIRRAAAGPRPARWRTPLGAAAAAVLLLACGLVWRSRQVAPRNLLTRVETVESDLHSQTLRQSFRVEMAQTHPVQTLRTARLRVWSEPRAGRFSARLDGGGGLKLAVWRPRSGEEYVYDTKVSRRSAATAGASLWRTLQNAPRVDSIEEAFVEWLKERDWRPVSLTRDLASFASSDGAGLRGERLNSSTWRLTAHRKTREGSAEITVDVDAATMRPRFERMRVERADRIVEMSLVAEEMAVAASFEPAVFEPPISPEAPEPAAAPETRVDAPLPAPPAVNPDAAEVRARYALHRTGACLGEPVEVTRGPDGRVAVRGLVETEGRRDELRAALQSIGDAIDAALEVGGGRLPPPAVPAESVALDPALPPEERQARLFARAALDSEAAMRHAWALRRLAERYSENTFSALPIEERWLVESMVRDHAHHLQQLLQRASLDGAIDAPDAAPLASGPAAGWPAQALSIFEQIRAFDARVRSHVEKTPESRP